jgi:hypothetical protein
MNATAPTFSDLQINNTLRFFVSRSVYRNQKPMQLI